MKEDLDDCIPRRKVFPTLVIGAHPIPLLREDLTPQARAHLLRSISTKRGIFLESLTRCARPVRNNDFAPTEEARIKRKSARAE